MSENRLFLSKLKQAEICILIQYLTSSHAMNAATASLSDCVDCLPNNRERSHNIRLIGGGNNVVTE